ncbi:hypothetical protein GGF46_001092 [Coemansia sp. RSA 552]|nr:hypothetical protein GGF46_001092 [Coemansia sp. RSA 552]
MEWWCYSHVHASIAAGGTVASIVDVEAKELDTVRTWVVRHPADYAAAHYLHQLWRTVSLTPEQHSAIIGAELQRTEADLSSLYAGYESVWMHRRRCLVELAGDGKKRLVDAEQEFLEWICQSHGDDRAAMELVARHKSWLVDGLP